MKEKSVSRPLFYVIVLALLTPSVGESQGAVDFGKRADSIFSPWNRLDGPGCIVDLRQGGQQLLKRSWGLAELEHEILNTPSTIFEAGSVSKQVTAAAVLLLAERGQISLDDPIQKFFPEIPEYEYPITVRHLVLHTSGLRDWGAMSSLQGWPRQSRDYKQEHTLQIVTRQKSLNHRPGEAFSYTNSGYNLMAILVANVSGIPFADFTHREFFAPLGMKSTSWRDDPRKVVKGRAQGYARNAEGGWQLSMPFEHAHGNGGLLTTTDDLHTWTDALSKGKIGNPSVTKAMQTEGKFNNNEGVGYGGGLYLGAQSGVPAVYHSGSTAGYKSFLAWYPETDHRISILCNAADAVPTNLAMRLLNGALPFTASTPSSPVPIAGRVSQPSDALKAMMEGVYTSDEAASSWVIKQSQGQLVLDRGPANSTPLTARGEYEFSGAGGMLIRFIPDSNGRITSLSATIARAVDVVFKKE